MGYQVDLAENFRKQSMNNKLSYFQAYIYFIQHSYIILINYKNSWAEVFLKS